MVVRGPAHQPLQRALWLLTAVLVGVLAVVLTLVAAGPLGDVPVAYAFPLIGGLYAGTGLLAWWRRPANRLGPLLVGCGALWLVASLGNTSDPVLIAAGTLAAVLPVSVLIHLLHAAPGGTVTGGLSRACVVAGYVVGSVLQAPLWAFTAQPPPYDLLLVADRPDLAERGFQVQQLVGLVVVVLTTAVLVRRLREYEPAQRRRLAPLFGYGVLAVLAIPLVANLLSPALDLGPELTAALQLATIATVPVGFLAVVLRGGFARTADLSALVSRIAAPAASAHDLDSAVAATLGDPSAELLRWSGDGYVTRDGAVAQLPADNAHRQAVPVEVGGERLGAVVYDTRLGTDPGAVAAVGRVAGIALDRDRLVQDLSASRDALRSASARLLRDSDQGRRQLARDLHDGLQGALVRLGVLAHRLAEESDGTERTALAGRLADDVDATAATLRAVIDGVVPPQLVERGLAAAVQDLAYDLPLRTAVQVEGLPERLPPTVETTAWFVVAEALTNVVKHAGAERVDLVLDLRDDVLVVDVRDDGGGGADDRRGSGLQGLRDRVEVLGGSLDVLSDVAGTRLLARLPCG